MLVERIGQFEGKAKEMLGIDNVDGTRATGFLIDLVEIDPDVDNGHAEVWIDVDTELPVLIKLATNTSPTAAEFTNFKWNLKFEADVFNPSPPEED